MSRPTRFIEADIRRACKAAPDRTIEIVFPDGTIIRLLPCDKLNLPSRKLRRKGRSGFKKAETMWIGTLAFFFW